MMFAHKQILYHCIPQVHLKGKNIFISVHFLHASRQVLKCPANYNHSMFGEPCARVRGREGVPPYIS